LFSYDRPSYSLPIEMLHCAELTKLPFHHRDPFDRMLIAQAMVEDMHLLSRDSRFSAYEITCIWWSEGNRI